MNSDYTLSFKAIIRLIILFALYIIYEINYLKAGQRVNSVEHNVVFYTFDIIYFLWGILFYLPSVWIKISNDVIRIGAIVIFIILYSFCQCLLGDANQIFLLGKIKYGITFETLFLASWRGFYITLAISTYSFLRFTIISNKEVEKQKLLTLEAEKNTLEAEKQKLEAEKRAIIAENNYLRTVLNPHFLVNVFNMQYRKAIMVDEGLANSIAHNAELVKYALQNNSEDGNVFLAEDISYMETYIELQQELHNHNLQVEFTTDIYPSKINQPVAPLLFLNFIDNVFKYGELSDTETPAKIYLKYDGNVLTFLAENAPNNRNDVESHNIGIENAKNRIQKHYGNRSAISITNNQYLFKVEISIAL